MATYAEVLIGGSDQSCAASCAAVSLPARAARVVVVDELPLVIRCTAGCVWITQEGDRRDHVLQPGDRFEASSHGEVVVFAFEKSDVVLSATATVVERRFG